ncbi:MAG: hypothetical protein V3U93_07435 [Alphaproteobacteria bacterium]
MEIVYFTVGAIVLYVVSDRLLGRVEVARGARFDMPIALRRARLSDDPADPTLG